MKRFHLVLNVLGIILVACAPVNGTERPTATLALMPTATATHTPTPTPEPTPTQETISIESLDLGDARYNQEIIKQGYPWKLEGDQLFVDWKKDGDYELAFEKVGDKWEIRKFVLKSGEIDINNLTCVNITDRAKEGSCIQKSPDTTSILYIKGLLGDLVLENVSNPVLGVDKPVPTIYVVFHTRREPGTPEIEFKVAVQADIDGMNVINDSLTPSISIFEWRNELLAGDPFTFLFKISTKNIGPGYFERLNAFIDTYLSILGGYNPLEIMFPSGHTVGGNMY